MDQPRPLLVYLRSFCKTYDRTIVDFGGIGTRIVGVEGKHTDHLTTTTTQPPLLGSYIFAPEHLNQEG